MLITPEYVFKDVTHITPEWLAAKGITALVLDIDNTLTADRSQELPEEVAAWLAAMRKAGVKLTIVSNGAEKRVRPFAEKLGLAYLYRAAKPLPFALMVAQHRMGVKHRQMAMVGDQLYADRMVAARGMLGGAISYVLLMGGLLVLFSLFVSVTLRRMKNI